MKSKREHVIPLSPQALEILEVMKPISAHREHVFPSRNDPKQPMNSQTANAAIKRIGYGGKLVAHRLRSIANTAMNEKRFNADLIEAALAHSDRNEVRRAYNRSIYLEQRIILMDWWGEYCTNKKPNCIHAIPTKEWEIFITRKFKRAKISSLIIQIQIQLTFTPIKV